MNEILEDPDVGTERTENTSDKKCIGISYKKKSCLRIQDQFIQDGLCQKRREIYSIYLWKRLMMPWQGQGHIQSSNNRSQQLMDTVLSVSKGRLYTNMQCSTIHDDDDGICPMFIDSRNRMLRPDPSKFYGPDGTEQPPPPPWGR